jgi:hypothetical protein
MDALHRIAEARLREAIDRGDRGDFDALPGFGQPLVLDDLSDVPDDLRASFIVCKNAGMLPPEMELRRDLVTLRDLLRACTDEGDRAELQRRLRAREEIRSRGSEMNLCGRQERYSAGEPPSGRPRERVTLKKSHALGASSLRLELLMERHRESAAWRQYGGSLRRRVGGR